MWLSESEHSSGMPRAPDFLIFHIRIVAFRGLTIIAEELQIMTLLAPNKTL